MGEPEADADTAVPGGTPAKRAAPVLAAGPVTPVSTAAPVTAHTLGLLYERHRGEMTGLARRLLAEEGVPRSAADADDVVNTAFARALRDPGRVREPRAYLFRLLRTEVAHLARRRAAHHRLEQRRLADPLRCDAPPPADLERLVVDREAVHRALRELPAQQRTAVWATKALDYTQAETAQAMRKRPGTVATHVARAVAALQTWLTAALVAAVIGLAALIRDALVRGTAADGGTAPAGNGTGGVVGAVAVPALLLAVAVAFAAVAVGLGVRSTARRRRSPSRSSRRRRVRRVELIRTIVYCPGCDADTVHEPPTSPEGDFLLRCLGRDSIVEFLVCRASECGNVRTVFNEKPFPVPLRIPELLAHSASLRK
ncbi:sigma-70 family RNA polymerase sigma factor [Streptomyces sp. G45]|uniref:sigma-70 family RNA polymerase sigma factor n=1 Tax=Streptomyces sp. G45 TaxID=3406627 RepID=UPI003C203C8C